MSTDYKKYEQKLARLIRSKGLIMWRIMNHKEEILEEAYYELLLSTTDNYFNEIDRNEFLFYLTTRNPKLFVESLPLLLRLPCFGEIYDSSILEALLNRLPSSLCIDTVSALMDTLKKMPTETYLPSHSTDQLLQQNKEAVFAALLHSSNFTEFCPMMNTFILKEKNGFFTEKMISDFDLIRKMNLA